MHTGSILVRSSDGKRFFVVLLSHWSEIHSEVDDEDDLVKWYGRSVNGREAYVSASKGFSYEVVPTTTL